MGKRVTTVVFPVGGLGTRFLPATKSIPKEMLPVVDKPLIQYAFEQAKDAGIQRFVFITGRNKNVISNHFDHVYELQKVLDETEKKHLLSLTRDFLPGPGNIAFIRQQQPLGLGHSILCARNFMGDEPFAVMLADELLMSGSGFLKDMIDLQEERGGNVIGLAEVAREDTSKYGIVDPKSDDGSVVQIKGMVEKPKPEVAPSNLSIIGHYVLDNSIFDYLEKSTTGVGGEIQLTDSLAAMAKDKPSHGLRYKGQRFDCGGKLGFLEANLAFALERDDMRDRMIPLLQKYAGRYGN